MTNRDQDLIERLNARAATMNGIQPVGAGDGDTYAVGYYGASDAKLDREAATALASSATRIAELEARLEAAPSPSPAPGVVTDDGLDQFTAYFVKNYPGPETIIHDPKWHAPRIFRAAKAASLSQPAKGEQS